MLANLTGAERMLAGIGNVANAVDLRRLVGRRACHTNSVSADGPSTSTGQLAAHQRRDCGRARSSAGGPSDGACGCRSSARPLCRPGGNSRWSLRPSTRTRRAGRIAPPRRTGTARRSPARVSPGESDDHAGADGDAGNCARIFSSSFRKMSPEAPRFMRFRTRARSRAAAACRCISPATRARRWYRATSA